MSQLPRRLSQIVARLRVAILHVQDGEQGTRRWASCPSGTRVHTTEVVARVHTDPSTMVKSGPLVGTRAPEFSLPCTGRCAGAGRHRAGLADYQDRGCSLFYSRDFSLV